MAKFSILTALSRRKSAPDAVNFAGGRAFAQTSKLEFVSILLTTFLEDEFYRTEKQTTARIRELITKVNDPRFVAKAALYARNTHGMRSVSHLVAGELAKSVKGQSWTKHFYAEVVRRPDDVMETLGYYLAVYGRPIPNSLKKGLGAALGRFDEYQLTKYRRDHGVFKLVDAVNLVRPKSSAALSKLVRDELAPAETWETKLTQAGQGEARGDVAAAKSQAWAELVRERKLGYLALLRNVRNVLTHAPEVAKELCDQLTDERAVRRSLVFPFQFLSAVEVLKHLRARRRRLPIHRRTRRQARRQSRSRRPPRPRRTRQREGEPDDVRAYCYVRVRGAMLDELRRLDPLSRRQRDRVGVIARARTELANRLGRAPSIEEIASAVQLSAAEVSSTIEAAAQASDTAEIEWDSIPDTQLLSPAEVVEFDDVRTGLGDALDRLPANQALALRRYYLEDATLDEIAAELGVSRERARQVREAGEKKLRADFVVLALWQSFVNRGRD